MSKSKWKKIKSEKLDSIFLKDPLITIDTIGDHGTNLKIAHRKRKQPVESGKLKKLVKKVINKNNKIIEDSNESDDVSKWMRRRRCYISRAIPIDIWRDDVFGKVPPKVANLTQLIPPVPAPHPGQSYNPHPNDLNKLIDNIVQTVKPDGRKVLLAGGDHASLYPNMEDHTSVQAESNILTTAANIRDHSTVDASQTDHLIGVPEDCSLDKADSGMVGAVPIGEGAKGAVSEQDERPLFVNDALTEGEAVVSSSDKIVCRRKSERERRRLKRVRKERHEQLLKRRAKKILADIHNMEKVQEESSSNINDKKDKLERTRNYIRRLITGKVPTRIGNRVLKNDVSEISIPENLSSLKNIKGSNSIDIIYNAIYRRGLLPPPPTLDKRYKAHIKKKFKIHYRSKLKSI